MHTIDVAAADGTTTAYRLTATQREALRKLVARAERNETADITYTGGTDPVHTATVASLAKTGLILKALNGPKALLLPPAFDVARELFGPVGSYEIVRHRTGYPDVVAASGLTLGQADQWIQNPPVDITKHPRQDWYSLRRTDDA